MMGVADLFAPVVSLVGLLAAAVTAGRMAVDLLCGPPEPELNKRKDEDDESSLP